MFRARILIIFPLVASGLFGCTGLKKSTPSTAILAAKVSAAITPTALQSCTLPAIFAANPQSQTTTAVQLSKMTGSFSLSSISLYSQTLDSTGATLNAFAVGASIKTGANGMRDTKLQNICEQSSAAAYTETLPVVMTLHLPSLRVTEFDVNDAQDLPATNHPTYASFIADSQGKLSLKSTFSDKGPPYSSALTMTDWLTTLPAQPSISTLADGSIEMRIHWSQKNTTNDAYLRFQTQ